MLKLCIVLAAYQSIYLQAFKHHRSSVRLYSRSVNTSLRAMTHGVKKENLPSKMCVTCNRPFTWRKKWERCWDEVTTCSKGCNAKRRALAQKDGRELPDDDLSDDEDDFKKVDSKKGGAHLKMEHKSVQTAGLRTLSISNDNKSDINDLENEDNQGEDEKPEKKLSRKKLQKLKMKEVPVESVSADHDGVTLNLGDIGRNTEKDKVHNAEDDNIIEDLDENDDDNTEIGKPEKKLSRKKMQKLKMKEDSEALASSKNGEDGKDAPTERTKTCAVCKGEDVLLFRCQWDSSKQWRFVCKSMDFKKKLLSWNTDDDIVNTVTNVEFYFTSYFYYGDQNVIYSE